MKKSYLIISIIIVMIILFYPKPSSMEQEGDVTRCDCLGVPTPTLPNATCYGLAVSCEQLSAKEYVNLLKEQYPKATCNNLQSYFGIDSTEERKKDIYTLVVIDSSKSMSGEKMFKTKEATKQLVQGIKDNEYFGLMEFNNNATMIATFTNNKQQLTSSVELLKPTGKTFFTQPLALAKKTFDNVPADTKKFLLILSDGSPEDKPSQFIPIANSLKSSDVNIYTLAFGGNPNKELLGKIASETNTTFSVRDSNQLQKTFRDIYTKITSVNNIQLVNSQLHDIYLPDQRIPIRVNAMTIKTKLPLKPGTIEKNGQKYFVPPGIIQATISGKNTTKIVDGTYDEQEYKIQLTNIEPGEYTVSVNLKIALEGCEFTGTKYLGSITLQDETKVKPCTPTCKQINEAMGSNKIAVQRINNVPINWYLLFDHSSSMSMYLDRMKHDTEEVLSFIPLSDTITAIAFDQNSVLLGINDKKYILEEVRQLKSGSTTQIQRALLKTNSMINNNSNAHVIIFTDGNFVDIEKSRREVDKLKQNACISVMSYGSHLSTDEQKNRFIESIINCGEHVPGRPERDELLNLLNLEIVNQSDQTIGFDIKTGDENSFVLIRPFSKYNQEYIYTTTNNCTIAPTLKTDQKNSFHYHELIGYYAYLNETPESLNISATYGLPSCEYGGSRTIIFTTPKYEPLSYTLGITLVTFLFMLFIIKYYALRV